MSYTTLNDLKTKFFIHGNGHDAIFNALIAEYTAIFDSVLGGIFPSTLTSKTKDYQGQPAGIRMFYIYFWQASNLQIQIKDGANTETLASTDYILDYADDAKTIVKEIKLTNKYIFRGQTLTVTGLFGYSTTPPQAIKTLFENIVIRVYGFRNKLSSQAQNGGYFLESEKSKNISVSYKNNDKLDAENQLLSDGDILGVQYVKNSLKDYLQPENLIIS